MTLGVRRTSRIEAWIAPGTALCFSIIVALLAPHYATWFGDAMPSLTRRFIDGYPIWIALSVLALVVQACAKALQPRRSSHTLWKLLDGALSIASVLIIAIGLIALALPLMSGPPI